MRYVNRICGFTVAYFMHPYKHARADYGRGRRRAIRTICIRPGFIRTLPRNFFARRGIPRLFPPPPLSLSLSLTLYLYLYLCLHPR